MASLPSGGDVERLAARIAAELLNGDPVAIRGPVSVATKAVAVAINENLATEAAIEREAERAIEAMGRETLGMDRHKLVQGMRERLAKKRGFVL